MRFQEDVDLLDKKDFVYFFCLASRTLSLLREVESLRKEVKELRERSPTEKGDTSGGKKSIQAEKKLDNQSTREDAPPYSAVVEGLGRGKNFRQKKGHPKPVSTDTGKKPTGETKKAHRAEMKKTGSPPKAREFVGRRKLWGTKRVDTEEEVKAFLVSRVPEAASLEVQRVYKSEDGRVRWWFWLVGEESVLKLVDGGSFGEFWKIEKNSTFLESVAVRVLSH